MRYAIISDVHGNLPALNAVLKDAKLQGIDKYIFAGDYCLSGPNPDDCITKIKELANSIVIRGNEERYLENLIGKNQNDWVDGQMQISYWCFRNVSSSNLSYILSLPHVVDTECNGVRIHAAHSSDTFIGECEFKYRGPVVIAKEFSNVSVTKEMLQRDTQAVWENNADFQERIASLEEGIYIFGHSHIQWTYRDNKRKVYLINPGSCGMPLDGVVNSAPYTIVDVTDSGMVYIDERRVYFDIVQYIDYLRGTSQYKEANVWSKVIINELETAKEHMTFFLEFVDRYANEIGDKTRPFSVETWERAYELWNRESFEGFQ